jgi:hypothetical protein
VDELKELQDRLDGGIESNFQYHLEYNNINQDNGHKKKE